MRPRIFVTAREWRDWLAVHHGSETEMLVGFRKIASGLPSMRWPESVDEALCFGWIDGVRKSIDESTYCIRFSPRKPGSIWSRVNIAKAEALIAAGKMTPAGLEKYRDRSAKRSVVYSFEQGAVEMNPKMRKAFRVHRRAEKFFLVQAPSYQKRMVWWIISARRAATFEGRLARLIAASDRGERL
jgi:uncharacterized protein YdeI (YjbR/CyaY-like superfamily)